MPAEKSTARFVDYAFVHRRGDHAGKAAVLDALIGGVQQLQNVGGVGGIEFAGSAVGSQRDVQHFQHARLQRIIGLVRTQ